MAKGERTGRRDNADPHLTTGQRISHLMGETGTSVRSLAGKAGIMESTLSNYLHGHRNIPSDVLETIFRELGTSADYLLERTEDPRPKEAVAEEARLRQEARRT